MNSLTSKKILHIISGLHGGGAQGVLVRLCQHSSTNFRHVVVSLGSDGEYKDVLHACAIPTYCLGMRPSIFSLWKIVTLVKMVRRERPDIVQTWMYHADIFGGIAACLAGVKHIFWNIRRSNLELDRSSHITRVITKLCAYLSHIIPEKIICCAHKAKILHQNIGYCANKLVVVQNGYDLSKFYPNSEMRHRLRHEINVRESDFLLGMVARFDPCKDHKNLLNALSFLKNKIDFQCVLVGENIPNNKDILHDICRLGLEKNIKLMGFRFDIQNLMNALDLHVLSSSTEGFPNVLAEVMACGVPTISTDVGDAKEILGDETMCCPSRDSVALADLIVHQKKEWEDAIVWQKKKSMCTQRIEQFFSIDSMVRNYTEIWLSPFVPSLMGGGSKTQQENKL